MEGLDALITVSQNKAAFFSADAVLSFLNDGSDKSIYLYGGTRLKTAVAHAISGKDIAVTKANNVKFSGVISAQRPEQRGTINLTSGGFMNRLTGYFKIENNVIALSKIQLVNLSSGSGDLPEMNGNVFAHKRDKMFGQVLDKNQMVRFDENIEEFIKKSMADKNAKVVYITD